MGNFNNTPTGRTEDYRKQGYGTPVRTDRYSPAAGDFDTHREPPPQSLQRHPVHDNARPNYEEEKE
jgi:hypothetical protein